MRKIESPVRPTALAFALGLAAAGSAAAADADPALKAAMQRDLGLSDQQLGQYVRTERLAVQQMKTLEQAQGRHFAGSWIERGSDGQFRLVVATTSIAPQAVPAGAEIRQVRHSTDSLRSAKTRLDDTLVQRGGKAPAGVHAWYVDERSNSVTVSVAPGAVKTAIDFVALSGADTTTVRFQSMADAPRPLATLQGGSEYISTTSTGSYYCSRPPTPPAPTVNGCRWTTTTPCAPTSAAAAATSPSAAARRPRSARRSAVPAAPPAGSAAPSRPGTSR